MDPEPANRSRKRRLGVYVAGACLITLVALGAWMFYLRLMAEPPLEELGPRRAQARAMLKLDAGQPNVAAAKPTPPANPPSTASLSMPPPDALQPFRRQVDEELLKELQGEFPELPLLLSGEMHGSEDTAYRIMLLRILDAEKAALAEHKAALLLAGDFVAQRLACGERESAECHKLGDEMAPYGLTWHWSELDGGWYYQGDLLWRVWKDYGTTRWGEAAFVLLLDRGWDTSTSCESGADRFREVIRQGESYLREHPASAYRAEELYLVAEAYETWWSLSRARKDDEYADPVRYQQGADSAREKAIASYEQVIQVAPQKYPAEIARQAVALLREGQDTSERKFFCVYD